MRERERGMERKGVKEVAGGGGEGGACARRRRRLSARRPAAWRRAVVAAAWTGLSLSPLPYLFQRLVHAVLGLDVEALQSAEVDELGEVGHGEGERERETPGVHFLCSGMDGWRCGG